MISNRVAPDFPANSRAFSTDDSFSGWRRSSRARSIHLAWRGCRGYTSGVRPRERARLNQVVCTLEGMATLLRRTPGGFAVVIHGDRDCLNVLVQGMDGPGTDRFYCTNLSEADAVMGRSRARLERCLEAVCGLGPDVVFLLGTCLSTLLGDELGSAASRVSASTGVPVVALEGAGMRFVSQASVVDRHAGLMLGAVEASGLVPDGRSVTSVNLVGFDPGREMIDLLGRLGIEVNSMLGLDASVEEFKRLPSARFNAVLDRELYGGFLEEASRRFGQRTVQVPFPVGHRASMEFLQALAGAVAPDRTLELVDDAAGEMGRQVESARGRVAGARLGYNIGSMKNLEPRTLALEGLSDLPAFEELGFEVIVLVQGDDRPERIEAVEATLEGFGCRAPQAVFADTVQFGRLCQETGCDLVYGADHLAGQMAPSKAGFLAFGSLLPGFEGTARNIERILFALESSRTGGLP